jgi:hypothetical protein
MTRRNEHEIVRYLHDGDPERDFPCYVGNMGEGGHVDPCERPVVMAVYGLAFCEAHGEEIRNGALEETHQDAAEFFDRFDNPQVPELANPLILRAVRGWRLALRDEDRFDSESTDDLLLAAFPLKRDKVWAETVEGIVDPPRGEDPPYDWLRSHRYELHQLMRHAYRLGLTFVVERIEQEREAVASQLAYVVALQRGASEATEVLEQAREEMEEDARKVAEHLGR